MVVKKEEGEELRYENNLKKLYIFYASVFFINPNNITIFAMLINLQKNNSNFVTIIEVKLSYYQLPFICNFTLF